MTDRAATLVISCRHFLQNEANEGNASPSCDLRGPRFGNRWSLYGEIEGDDEILHLPLGDPKGAPEGEREAKVCPALIAQDRLDDEMDQLPLPRLDRNERVRRRAIGEL